MKTGPLRNLEVVETSAPVPAAATPAGAGSSAGANAAVSFSTATTLRSSTTRASSNSFSRSTIRDSRPSTRARADSRRSSSNPSGDGGALSWAVTLRPTKQARLFRYS